MRGRTFHARTNSDKRAALGRVLVIEFDGRRRNCSKACEWVRLVIILFSGAAGHQRYSSSSAVPVRSPPYHNVASDRCRWWCGAIGAVWMEEEGIRRLRRWAQIFFAGGRGGEVPSYELRGACRIDVARRSGDP